MPSTILSAVQKIGSFLIDLLFPNLCFGCGKGGTLLCVQCEHRIPLIRQQRCFVCQKNPVRYGEACFECVVQKRASSSLDAVFTATCYHVPVIKRMIHAFKYRFVSSFSNHLGKILAKAVETSGLPLPTILIPVPLHTRRLRYRGFNQSELLSIYLTTTVVALSNTPSESLLVRNRATKAQQKTASKEERLQNLQSAFQIRDSEKIKDATVWLIDDVATTGSTLIECAKVLKQAGAQKVYGVVLARD